MQLIYGAVRPYLNNRLRGVYRRPEASPPCHRGSSRTRCIRLLCSRGLCHVGACLHVRTEG